MMSLEDVVELELREVVYRRKSNCLSPDSWGTPCETGKASETLPLVETEKGKGTKRKCSPSKNSILETKLMQETFQENRMKPQNDPASRQTCDSFVADGLNMVIVI